MNRLCFALVLSCLAFGFVAGFVVRPAAAHDEVHRQAAREGVAHKSWVAKRAPALVDARERRWYPPPFRSRVRHSRCWPAATPRLGLRCQRSLLRSKRRVMLREIRHGRRYPPRPPAWWLREAAGVTSCESGGLLTAVSRSPAGLYRGKYQFDLQTWRANGGTGDPVNASGPHQDSIAWATYQRRGWQPWPVCGRPYR